VAEVTPLTAASGVVARRVDAAFAELYASCFDEMVRLATAVGGAAGAEDVVQDAFANLLLRWHRVDDPVRYLRRSVVNGCVGRFRRRRREVLVADHRDGAAAATGDRLEVEALLADLPDRQRAALVLRFTFGLSEQETADALGCRPGTVGSLVHRGLAGLRAQMGPRQGGGEER
jgi:RNA polymerase sigma factor (sigma-70 family)